MHIEGGICDMIGAICRGDFGALRGRIGIWSAKVVNCFGLGK